MGFERQRETERERERLREREIERTAVLRESLGAGFDDLPRRDISCHAGLRINSRADYYKLALQ